jgi:elongation factor G
VQVLKTLYTAQGGKLSLARVLSGELTDGATVFGGKGQEARIAGILAYAGTSQSKIAKAVAGQTVALGRLDGIATGETVSTAKGVAKQLAPNTPTSGVYGFAISVADRKDEVKLTGAVHRLIEEDPSLSLTHDHDTGEMVLWGQGEMHLRVAIEKLASKFGVHAQSKPRRIAYKETIRKSVQIRGRHKKQSGGHGQYGDVVVEIKPLARGEGFVFTDTITGGVVPKQYIPAVEAGIRDWMSHGPLGFPVVVSRRRFLGNGVQDGSAHRHVGRHAAMLAGAAGAGPGSRHPLPERGDAACEPDRHGTSRPASRLRRP